MPDPAPVTDIGLRERRRDITRRSLEDAALLLFARDGYDVTTVDAIAAQAHVSPRTFFRYFAAKDEVLNPARRARQARLKSAVSEAPAGLDDLDAAATALLTIADDLAADRGSLVLQRQASERSAVVRGRTQDVLQSWQHTLAEALAVRRGLSDIDFAGAVTAAAVIGAWQAAISAWLDDDDTELRHHLEQAFAILSR